MMPAASLPFVGSVQIPFAMGLVVLGALLAALVTKVLLQSTALLPRRRVLRMLDVVIWPLLVVFVIVVLVRFRDLA
jgi:hypothetical protein